MINIEEWKAIKDFPQYEVSNKGRIRRVCNQRIKVPEVSKQTGYPTIRLSYGIPTKKKHFNIHRLVAEAFVPNPDNLPVVNHIDGNKLNNDSDNLEWCTYAYNNKHAYDHKLKRAWMQKIMEEDYPVIAELRKSGTKVKDIAKMYGVNTSAIYQLFHRGKIK